MTLAAMADAAAPVCRLAVGLTFLLSGVGKLAGPRAFADGVAAYRILPPGVTVVAARSVIAAELLAATSLLTGVAQAAGAVLAMALGAAFGTAVGTNLARGLRVRCHCFGAGEPIAPRTLVRVGLLVIAAALVAGAALAGHAPVAALWSVTTLTALPAAAGLVLVTALTLAVPDMRALARAERGPA